jgi:hypothetical protein
MGRYYIDFAAVIYGKKISSGHDTQQNDTQHNSKKGDTQYNINVVLSVAI